MPCCHCMIIHDNEFSFFQHSEYKERGKGSSDCFFTIIWQSWVMGFCVIIQNFVLLKTVRKTIVPRRQCFMSAFGEWLSVGCALLAVFWIQLTFPSTLRILRFMVYCKHVITRFCWPLTQFPAAPPLFFFFSFRLFFFLMCSAIQLLCVLGQLAAYAKLLGVKFIDWFFNMAIPTNLFHSVLLLLSYRSALFISFKSV